MLVKRCRFACLHAWQFGFLSLEFQAILPVFLPLTGMRQLGTFAHVKMDYSHDPLSAPTLHERLRALYQACGYNRRQFAIAMNVGYSVVMNWENAKHVPTIAMLRRACELLEVSADDLIYGRDEPRPAVRDASAPVQGRGADAGGLDLDALRVAFDRLGASGHARAALMEHAASDQGRVQSITLDYALAYAVAYDARIAAGADPVTANNAAYRAAVNARGQARYATHGRRATPTQARSDTPSYPSRGTSSPTSTPAPAPAPVGTRARVSPPGGGKTARDADDPTRQGKASNPRKPRHPPRKRQP